MTGSRWAGIVRSPARFDAGSPSPCCGRPGAARRGWGGQVAGHGQFSRSAVWHSPVALSHQNALLTRPYPDSIATNLLDDPSVRAVVTNYRDITERLAQEARLNEQLQRLALLARITHAIGERQDVHSIFQAVVARLEEEMPVDFC